MALANPREVEEKLMKELRAKRMIWPFLGSIFQSYVISPLGLRAKKVPDKFRVIQDLSAPFDGVSLNSCIPWQREWSHKTRSAQPYNSSGEQGPGPYWLKQMSSMSTNWCPDIPALGIRWF